jgi:hypothetical protein
LNYIHDLAKHNFQIIDYSDKEPEMNGIHYEVQFVNYLVKKFGGL